MRLEVPHISVCICTYKRPSYLAFLLARLAVEDTGGLFTYSIVVVDNDRNHSAEPVVAAFARDSQIEIRYLVEPRQSIALARNMAVHNASGQFVAFIDDDEFPSQEWLKILFTECEKRHVDGVLGPVKPHYETSPPNWVVVGRFYDRPSYPTGLVIDGKMGRTGNVLFRNAILDAESGPFRAEFRTGEDQDFFSRMISKGYIFVWCHEAIAYEWVPSLRWRRAFLLKRALLRGTSSALRPNICAKDIMKSAFAVLAYIIVLPFASLVSHGKFMLYLVSLCDHVGRLLGIVGINPVNEPYVTES
jgi:succinoglycan biosynthesis protein ExoM